MSTPRRRVETPWGPWEPFTPAELDQVFAGVDAAWWIGGGWALEAFVGSAWRPHDDVDVGLFRDEQNAIRRHLNSWDVRCADPPGTLRPWPAGETLPAHVHDVWVRAAPDQPWRFQLMLDERTDGSWRFRRDPRITRAVATLTWQREGRRYLAPEVQLLYKAKGMRTKDRADFEHTLPHLSPVQRGWLREALSTVHPGHEWAARLDA